MVKISKSVVLCVLVAAVFVMPISAVKNDVMDVENREVATAVQTNVANGVILDQQLDTNNKGYTVMYIWGSHYEMGYAQAELLGDYLVQGLREIKDYLGGDYDRIKNLIADSVWMPPGIGDEIDGMVDCLAVTHPSEDIDGLDIKVANAAGDWLYACRAHTCWGRYVSEPIKTLTTVRLDWQTFFPLLNHHVLCAHGPDDGSPGWVSFGFPGIVVTVSGVNEFGTVVRGHDYDSFGAILTGGRMSRSDAGRHALTFATDSDVSAHLATVNEELENYKFMTRGFVNYYAPEGHGGVITLDPDITGVYHLRLPQSSWHHGEAMITTNQWTDGTFTPQDEDFGADEYYDDETPKTLESHWNLLSRTGGALNLHMLGVAYRDRGDMTIWAQGRKDPGRTPRLEWEWSELFAKPDIRCEGSLSWTGVTPGDTVTGSFTVENSGDSDSRLDWVIEECPEWGEWIFSPMEGDDLKPEDGSVTVQVSVVAPDDQNQDFTGELKIANRYDSSNFDIMPVSLATPLSQHSKIPLLFRILELFPNAFPLLEQLLRL